MSFSSQLISRIPKNMAWGFFTLAVVSLFLFFYTEDRDNRKDVPAHRLHSYMEGIQIVNKNKNGSDSWIISAERAEFLQNDIFAKFNSVVIKMIDRGVIVNADNGTYNTRTKELLLNDNITIQSKGYTVSAKGLSWNPQSEEMTSDNKVSIQGEKFRIEGEGINSAEGNKIKLLKNVRASFF